VVPFGIDADAWQPNDGERKRAVEIRREAGRPIVLFAGRHVPYKGVPVLIEAAAPLDVSVVILGDGPMREAWTALARAQQGRASYSFPGEVSDHELRAHLVASRMFVLPSVTRAEAFGYIQLEAMACATPVISTALPTGVPWVNESGLVVPVGDVGALRAAIEQLAGDSERAAQVGARGEARARSAFTMEEMADRLVTVCRELAGRAP
jgi:rhamnosyl/mannosyltransferase